jgi:glycolate oxidase FAD binding subunit
MSRACSAGSLGTLGIVLEVSLKVLPLAGRREERAFCARRGHRAAEAQSVGRPALADFGLGLVRRRSDAAPVGCRCGGCRRAAHARRRALDDAEAALFWSSLREQTHAFFAGEAPLWRLSLPSVAPPQALGPTLIEWGGAQRWLRERRRSGDPRGSAAKPVGTRRCFGPTTR